jgi:hypothetical protein
MGTDTILGKNSRPALNSFQTATYGEISAKIVANGLGTFLFDEYATPQPVASQLF